MGANKDALQNIIDQSINLWREIVNTQLPRNNLCTGVFKYDIPPGNVNDFSAQSLNSIASAIYNNFNAYTDYTDMTPPLDTELLDRYSRYYDATSNVDYQSADSSYFPGDKLLKINSLSDAIKRVYDLYTTNSMAQASHDASPFESIDIRTGSDSGIHFTDKSSAQDAKTRADNDSYPTHIIIVSKKWLMEVAYNLYLIIVWLPQIIASTNS